MDRRDRVAAARRATGQRNKARGLERAEHVERAWLAAETATQGNMVNARGRAPASSWPERGSNPPRHLPRCNGAGRRQRHGSRTVHQLARRVRRELDRQRKARQTERTITDADRSM